MKTLLKINFALLVFIGATLTCRASIPVVQGPSSTGQGSTQTYTFTNGTLVTGAYWVVTNASTYTEGVNGTTYSVTITWSSSATSGTVAFWGYGDPGTMQATKNVTLVTCSQVPTPSPVVPGGSQCYPGGTVNISVTSPAPSTNYTIRWYNIGSNLIVGTGASIPTPYISTTTNYYATALLNSSGCESAPVQVTATIITPTATFYNNKTICQNSSTAVTITNNFPGTVNNWIVNSSSNVSGASLGSGTVLDQTLVAGGTSNGSVTYRITPTYNNCQGPPADLTVIVSQLPVVTPTVTAPAPSNQLVYGTELPTFTVNVPSGRTANWYGSPDPNDNNVLFTGSSHTNIGLTDLEVYYVSFIVNGTTCVSNRSQIRATRVSYMASLPNVTSETVRVSGKTSDTDIDVLTATSKSKAISYIDGLARTKQVIALNATPTGADMVQHVEYDQFGRTPKDYMPYAKAATNGAYQTAALTDQAAFYTASNDKIADDSYPFALALYESSPLGRVLEQGDVGQVWQPNGPSSHTQRVAYSYNAGATSDELEEVRLFASDGITFTSTYAANTLSRATVTDENNNTSVIFTDALGRTIVRKQQLNSTINGSTVNYLQTYYIYDDMNRLKYIITPGGFAAIKANSYVLTQTIIDQHLHQFIYDTHGRLIKKKTPGQDWTYYIYDKFNRLVLMQDANTRTVNKWAFVKYDLLGRPVVSGLYLDTQTDITLMQNTVNTFYSTNPMFEQRGTSTLNTGYTNQSFPTANIEVLSINYYDNYNFDNTGGDDYTYSNTHIPSFTYNGQPMSLPANATAYLGKKLTGAYRLVLGTTNNWLKTVVFYDNYGRAVQTISNNHLNLTATDRSSVVYDFEGKVIKTKSDHNGGGTNQYSIAESPIYDALGQWPTGINHNINNAASDQQVVKYNYNELGQVVMKQLHNTSGSFLQNVDYRYNIKGWLTSINNAQLVNDANVTNGDTNDYFGMEMNYNTDAGNSNTLYYNGNVSSVKWKGAGAASGAAGQRSYKFAYDKTNKLLTATFQKYGTSAWDKELNTLNETMSYDHNGNILSLQRTQNQRGLSGTTVTSTSQLMDNLTYSYADPNYSNNTGNKLFNVTDAALTDGFADGNTTGQDYAYDSHGNATKDLNKGISSITYNVLGKAQQINYTDGKQVSYTYSADGDELKMTSTVNGTTTTTDYADDFQYTNGSLSFISTPEGRAVKNSSGGFDYQYSISDHQGNTRVLFTSAPQTAVTSLLNFDANASDDPLHEFQVDGGKVVSSNMGDPLNSGNKAVVLKQDYAVGPAINKSVYPGDKVDLDVYSYYEATSGYGTTSASLTGIISSVTGALIATTGGVDGGGLKASGVNSALGAGGFGVGANQGDAAPAAFLNYILFDKKYKVMDAGWQVVPATSMAKQHVVIPTITVNEPGFIFVYLSYEDLSNNQVFFDDFNVKITPTPVLQSSEYYPFGLQTAQSWTRDNVPSQSGNANSFLYNEGSELNATTGLYDLPFRNYDPLLGRMHQIDPLAVYDHDLSPYQYAYNDPIGNTDPSGLMPPLQDLSYASRRALYHAHDGNSSDGFASWAQSWDESNGYYGYDYGWAGPSGGGNGGTWVKEKKTTWVPGIRPSTRDAGTEGHYEYSYEDVFIPDGPSWGYGGPNWANGSMSSTPSNSGGIFAGGGSSWPRDRRFLTNGKSSPNPLRDPLGAVGWLIGRVVERGVSEAVYLSSQDIGLFGVQALEMVAVKEAQIVWNLTESVLLKKHHNWMKFFGSRQSNLDEIAKAIQQVISDGMWEKTGKVIHGKRGVVIGEGLIKRGMVDGHEIWVEATLLKDGKVIIKNSGVN